jgi:hypothetical protein
LQVKDWCPLCKQKYELVTKRHPPDSEGVSPDDEIIMIQGAGQAPEEGEVRNAFVRHHEREFLDH